MAFLRLAVDDQAVDDDDAEGEDAQRPEGIRPADRQQRGEGSEAGGDDANYAPVRASASSKNRPAPG